MLLWNSDACFGEEIAVYRFDFIEDPLFAVILSPF